MRPARAAALIRMSIRRNRRAFVLASTGLVVGVATFTFFLALGQGIEERVLNRIYPIHRIEVEPASVGIVGLRASLLDDADLGPEMVQVLEGLPGVAEVYPKMRSRLQARLWGGKALFGHALRTEAFMDGIHPELIHEEARLLEGMDEKLERHQRRKERECLTDEECPLGQECDGDRKTCGPVGYWKRFRTVDAPGDCEADGDCPSTHGCHRGQCKPLTCRLSSLEAQYSDRPGETRGRLLGRCGNGLSPDDPGCSPLPCPGRSYCAARNVTVTDGVCEEPLPVVLSPFLIEVFNSSVASSLGFQPLDGVDALLGTRFRIHLGGSYFSDSLPRGKQVIKSAEVVGFSGRALDFGLTLPLETVRDLNTRFRGEDKARSYDSFILEAEGNADISGLISELESRGLALTRKSEDARKAGDLLFILTLVFGLISTVILGVAAVSISHTFLMVVSERRQEIGVLRALGATRGDIRVLVLGEAMAVGLFGAVVGELIGYGLSRLVNLAAADLMARIPYGPEDLFIYHPMLLVGGLAYALLFSALGALAPARRAARVDPARVLMG